MSGRRGGGMPPRGPSYDRRDDYRESYNNHNNSSPASYRDSHWHQDRDRDRSRDRSRNKGRDRPRSESRSPKQPRERGGRDSFLPGGGDQRESSSASSLSGSPMHPSRALALSKPVENQSPLRTSLALDTVAETASTYLQMQDPNLVDESNASQGFVEIFNKLVDKSSEVTALKVEQSTAKTIWDEREALFSKSSQLHDRFPNTKDYQTVAREKAEEAFHAKSAELQYSQTDINQLGHEALQSLIPYIAKLASTARDKEILQSQNDILEQVRSSHEELIKQIATQSKFIEELKTDHEELRKNNTELRLHNIQLKTTMKVGLDTANAKLATFEEDIIGLRTDVFASKEGIDAAKLATDNLLAAQKEFNAFEVDCNVQLMNFSERAIQLDALKTTVDTLDNNFQTESSANVRKYSDLGERLNRVEVSCSTPVAPSPVVDSFSNDTLRSSLFRIKSIEEQVEASSGKIEKLEEGQQSTSNLSKGLSEKFDDLQSSTKQELQTLETAVTKADGIQHANKEQFEALRKKFAELEDQQSVNALENRVTKIEDGQKTIKSIKAEIKSAFGEDMERIEARLAKVEEVQNGFSPAQVSEQPPPTSIETPRPSIAEPISTDFSARLKKLEVTVTGIQVAPTSGLSQDFIVDLISNTVDQAIEQELKPVEETLESLRVLPADFKALQDTQTESIAHQSNGIADLKQNLVAVTTARVVEQIQAPMKQELLDTMQMTLGSFQKEQAGFRDELNGLSLASNSHEARMNNISTGGLATFMLDQITSQHPAIATAAQLQSKVDQLAGIMPGLTAELKALGGLREKVDTSMGDIKDLRAASGAAKERIDNLTQQRDSSNEVLSDQFANIEVEFEKFGDRINDLENTSSEPKNIQPPTHLDPVAVKDSIETELKPIREQLASVLERSPEDLITQLTNLENQIDGLKASRPENVVEQLAALEKQLRTLSERQENLPDIESTLQTVKEQLESAAVNNEKRNSDVEDRLVKAKEQIDTLKDNQRNMNQDKIPSIEKQLSKLQEQFKSFAQEEIPKLAIVPPVLNKANGTKTPQPSSSRSSSNSTPRPPNPPTYPLSSVAGQSRPRQPVSAPKVPSKSHPTPSTDQKNLTDAGRSRNAPSTGDANKNGAPRSGSRPTNGVRTRDREDLVVSDLEKSARKRKRDNSNAAATVKQSRTSNIPPVAKKPKIRGAFLQDVDSDNDDGSLRQPTLDGDEDDESDDCQIVGVKPATKPPPMMNAREIKRQVS